jgi:hypothetical protein
LAQKSTKCIIFITRYQKYQHVIQESQSIKIFLSRNQNISKTYQDFSRCKSSGIKILPPKYRDIKRYQKRGYQEIYFYQDFDIPCIKKSIFFQDMHPEIKKPKNIKKNIKIPSMKYQDINFFFQVYQVIKKLRGSILFPVDIFDKSNCS